MSVPSRLADQLSAARRRRFVGRAGELELFRSALAAPELPFHLLHICGPGGVGKTTLLGELVRLCAEAGAAVAYLDGRNVEPLPESFAGALSLALGGNLAESPLDLLARRASRHAILVDTYETLGPLDEWLRETFLPQLPENTLVVLASREALGPAWRADPGWHNLIRTVALRNLSPDESRAYLDRREVPPDQHRAVLDFTHGHPLALSLVADVFAQRPNTRFQPEAAPDVVKALLGQLVQKVPGPAHRAALEAAGLVRLTTESLLAEMLGVIDAHELFDWLRGLSFVESGSLGVFPHDLAREALAADLRWRNPDWYAELHRRAREYYARRLQQSRGRDQQRILFDYIFLHRDNPLVRPFFNWQDGGSLLPEAYRPADRPALLEMVARHEGGESAELAAHWLDRQPRGTVVFRDAEQPVGFLAMVALREAASDDVDRDPAARAARDYLRRRAPLRPGEDATVFRFWMARDTYQGVSTVQSHIFVNMVRHYLTPGLAFTFLPCAEPEFWAPAFSYADLDRLPEADFVVGGRRYGVYGHDWRAVPLVAWLALLAERELDATPPAGTPSAAAEAVVVLSRPDFEAAVHAFLRDFTRPDLLLGNPLVRSRLAVECADAGASPSGRVIALQRAVIQASELLLQSPRDAKLHRVLHHTFYHPAPTQERAAELLDLPFSTYRRHLKAGIARVAETLWQWEIGAMERGEPRSGKASA